ncbi:polysaccharide deacetylase family protein [Paenibacillus aestuarii]|uniref:Polysaccharide deacetylase family protein n=1 Tax=Paenibacillus aestuarii TaxID=516965 RepID=A0ABW0KBC6_9BACL|nr:polysaccharide deacetylase family protein [Paenibacillus aestuarii]
MRAHPQPSNYKMRKRIQLFMAVLLAAYVWLASMPVEAFANESNPAQEDQAIYQLLKSGKRPPQEKSYQTPEQPTVYLTFDDGPSKLTPQVLDILQKEGIHATFFALGEEAKARPDLIKRIIAEGHTLGNHTYNHVYNELYSDFQVFWKQIQESETIFDQIAGVRPQLVRAPGGTYTNFDAYYFYLLEQAGYTIVDWNVDSGDSTRANVPVKEIIHTVKSSPLEHEITLLLHDGAGHESSVEALPQIIQYYKDLGYAFAPLTSEVKPKQFSVGKPKWSRKMSLTHFEDLLQETKQYALAHGQPSPESDKAANQLVNQTQVAQAESAQTLPPAPSLPLQVNVGGGRGFTLEPTQYQLQSSRIELSLRFLVEKMGGYISWMEPVKTAIAHYGVYDVEYDLPKRSIRLFNLGKRVASYSMADMQMREGSIIVPLRKTIDLLGGRVTDAVMETDKREVTLAWHHLFMLNETPILLKNSLFALK